MTLSESLNLIYENRQVFISGFWLTIHLTFFSLVLGMAIALPCSLILSFKTPVLSKIVAVYVYIFRGSPLLVQLFLIYNGLAQFDFIRESFLWTFLKEPYWCALLAFGLNSGAYTAVIIQGAIETTPKGEIEAARAYGMSIWLQIKRIILPSAFRRALPTYSNEIIFTLHGSALASTVQLMDILGAGRWLNGRYYVSFEGFITAGILYAFLTICIILLLRPLEKKWNLHLKPRIQ